MAQTPADPTQWGLPADAVEDVSARTRDSKTFALPDGRRTVVIGRGLHYRAAVGQPWVDAGYTVVQSAPGTWVVHDAQVQISANYNALQLFDQESRKSLTWVMVGSIGGWDGTTVTYDGVPWQYAPTPGGVKSNVTVTTKQGPKTFVWNLLTDATNLRVDAGGNLVADQFRVPRATIHRADGRVDLAGPWQIPTPGQVRFSWDDSALPAGAYPYVIDPTTDFNAQGASGDGGYAVGIAGTYPPAAYSSGTDAIRVQKTNDAGTYTVDSGLLRIDTSSLPDNATPSAASLRLTQSGSLSNPDLRTLGIEYYASSNWPIGTNDYSATVSGNAASGVSLSNWGSSGAQYTVTLSNVGNISLTGYTGFRMALSGGAPSGTNLIYFYTPASTTASRRPLLSVTYTTSQTYDETAGTVDVPVALSGTETLALSETAGTVDVPALIAGGDTQQMVETAGTVDIAVALDGLDSAAVNEHEGVVAVSVALDGTDHDTYTELTGVVDVPVVIAGDDTQQMVESGDAALVPVALDGADTLDATDAAGIVTVPVVIAGSDGYGYSETAGVLLIPVVIAGGDAIVVLGTGAGLSGPLRAVGANGRTRVGGRAAMTVAVGASGRTGIVSVGDAITTAGAGGSGRTRVEDFR